MLRILFFLFLVLALGFGFAWVADRPGAVTLAWQGESYETSLMVALGALVTLIAAIIIVWVVIRAILNSPSIMKRFMRERKRDRGYAALSQGLIAAGAGDAAAARRYSKESTKLLGQAPLVGLLDAQTSLLEGKRDQARLRFEKMLDDAPTKLIALRGLYLEAEKQGASEAARHYVETAAKLAPSVPWAGNAILRYRASDGDWAGALNALESNRSAGLIDKSAAMRQRAVLLTAQAMQDEQSDPASAVKLAREAHKLAPDLVPAAIVGARALMRNNDLRKAANMLVAVWKKQPHPEIADAYVHLRIGDSALDRLKRAKRLAAMKANNPEGNMAVGEAAIEAKEWQLARDAMKPVLTTNPTERACLIMADIEEGEFGDKGRMRDWLSRAVRSPKDAAWTADGYVSDKWLPLSPLTGKVDVFEWKVPVEQLGGPAGGMLDKDDLDDLMAPADRVEETSVDTEKVAVIDDLVEEAEETVESTEEKIAPAKDNAGEIAPAIKDAGKAKKTYNSEDPSSVDVSEDSNAEIVFPPDRRPDDPGVVEDATNGESEPKKRFGLF